MVFEKIVFGVIAILIVWVMWPHARQGEFLAPNPLPPNTWMEPYFDASGDSAIATPPEGYGFRRYDAWNNPPRGGRSVTREDVRLHW